MISNKTHSKTMTNTKETTYSDATEATREVHQKPESTPSVTPIKDRFADPEYVNPNARLPKIQALRGENGAVDCGYFVTESEMAKAGWGDFNEADMMIYEYNSGGRERGLLLKSPRMLVVPRSPLFAFDRIGSRQEERLVVAGQYSKQLYSNREKYGTAQCYEVVLLDKNNEPMHEIGFAYVAKGANQAGNSSLPRLLSVTRSPMASQHGRKMSDLIPCACSSSPLSGNWQGLTLRVQHVRYIAMSPRRWLIGSRSFWGGMMRLRTGF
jgi:Family of unknown function (DUF5895)